MDDYNNNYETLEHFEGTIWVSKLFKTENRGNICCLRNGEFDVLAYISPDQLENKELHTVVYETLKARGTQYMLSNRIGCSICGKEYDEADVNIVDFEDDVCISCEKNYKKIGSESIMLFVVYQSESAINFFEKTHHYMAERISDTEYKIIDDLGRGAEATVSNDVFNKHFKVIDEKQYNEYVQAIEKGYEKDLTHYFQKYDVK